MSTCVKATWRGKTVCAHMVPKLNSWAKAVGDDIYLKPLQGCWNPGGVQASAGTHDYGGAIDIDCRGLTLEQKRRIEKTGRQFFGMSYYRPANSTWVSHVHAGDPACPRKAASLAAQFPKYWDGKNALANNLADTGYRSGTWIAADKAVFYLSRLTWFLPIIGTFTTLLAQAGAKAPTTTAPKPTTVNYNYPYQNIAKWFPVPDRPGSMYGPSTPDKPYYSGRVAGGTKTGVNASGDLSLSWIKSHIRRIQRTVGAYPDGIYGSQTVTKVKAWQKSHRLTVDGRVGPQTWGAMARSKGQGR